MAGLNSKLMELYMKEPTENILRELLCYRKIVIADRAWANECQAGTAMMNINDLFRALEKVEADPSTANLLELFELLDAARQSWANMRTHINSMVNDSRVSEAAAEIEKLYPEIKRKESNIEAAKVEPNESISEQTEDAPELADKLDMLHRIANKVHKTHGVNILVADTDKVIATGGPCGEMYIDTKLSDTFKSAMADLLNYHVSTLSDTRNHHSIFPCEGISTDTVYLARVLKYGSDILGYFIILDNYNIPPTHFELLNDLKICSGVVLSSISSDQLANPQNKR